jgi:hypothetical protein
MGTCPCGNDNNCPSQPEILITYKQTPAGITLKLYGTDQVALERLASDLKNPEFLKLMQVEVERQVVANTPSGGGMPG